MFIGKDSVIMKNHETEWISRYLNTPVEITTDLSLICDYEYDQALAKCHIANYGHIYLHMTEKWCACSAPSVYL